jgi:hypothetical protein
VTGPFCHLCRKPVSARTAWKEVAGYVSPHGADSMVGRRDTGRLVCPECVTRIRHRVSVQQETLV